MQIKCLGCGQREFSVDVPSVESAKVITFICPDCGECTAVEERPGGGVVVTVDRSLKEKS